MKLFIEIILWAGLGALIRDSGIKLDNWRFWMICAFGVAIIIVNTLH